MSNGLNLDFQVFFPCFEFADCVEGAVAETHSPYAAAWLVWIQARPFGNAVIHQKAHADGTIKTEKVEAFTYDRYLIVTRTIGDITRVFKFQAPSGLLLQEAMMIAQEHYKMSTLELI